VSADALELGHHAGREAVFTKTVSESDVYLFAGITGDLAPYHTDEEMMRGTIYGGRIAHGVLTLGFVSTVSTQYWTDFRGTGTTISYGYDRVRFLAGVRIGDTVTVRYHVASVDTDGSKVFATAVVTNQRNETVLSATHITKVISLQE
jgi:3-hydroxybutyryl-CoA dehydratase